MSQYIKYNLVYSLHVSIQSVISTLRSRNVGPCDVCQDRASFPATRAAAHGQCGGAQPRQRQGVTSAGRGAGELVALLSTMPIWHSGLTSSAPAWHQHPRCCSNTAVRLTRKVRNLCFCSVGEACAKAQTKRTHEWSTPTLPAQSVTHIRTERQHRWVEMLNRC